MSKKDWVSVDEKLPEVGVMVLVVIDNNGSFIYDTDCLKDDGTWKYEMPAYMGTKIIAWCPIPDFHRRY